MSSTLVLLLSAGLVSSFLKRTIVPGSQNEKSDDVLLAYKQMLVVICI